MSKLRIMMLKFRRRRPIGVQIVDSAVSNISQLCTAASRYFPQTRRIPIVHLYNRARHVGLSRPRLRLRGELSIWLRCYHPATRPSGFPIFSSSPYFAYFLRHISFQWKRSVSAGSEQNGDISHTGYRILQARSAALIILFRGSPSAEVSEWCATRVH